VYRNFTFVLRNYHARFFSHPGIRTLPLGWTNGSGKREEAALASQRRTVWTFAGNRNWVRHQMVEELLRITPNCVRLCQSGRLLPVCREEYLGWLRDAAFCPCPMENVVLETFRLYEALEAGCIPLVERRRGFDYFRLLLGENPLPSVMNWREGARSMQRLLCDRQVLDAHQQKIGEWWQSYKRKLQSELKDFILRGFAGEWNESLQRDWCFRSGIRHDLRRRLELLRHHTLGAALVRIREGVRKRGPSILWRGGPRFKENQEV
jgi:hypothetical protein